MKEAALIADILAKMDKPVVFDIGANLGAHALSMSRYADIVYAFEPFDPLANRLEEQIRLNGFDNIRVHRFGLGNKDENKTYYLDETSSNSGTGSFIPEHADATAAGEFPVRRGDDWANDIRPDFIKIDVEGYEGIALKGLSNTLAESRPIILMEVTQSSSKVFLELGGLANVIPFGFDVYEIINPSAFLGLFQTERYQLKKRTEVIPRAVSYNVLIVPPERGVAIEGLKRV
ncbi:MAG: FkbM family methyltransferase [Xanthomonadaceae bacterium]|nr:FkbM family methyltransferase [Xanthomonadaceae bacterium]